MNKPTITTPRVEEIEQTGRPAEGAFFESRPAKLILADGASFDGRIPSWQPEGIVGEVVFNTGMTGYVETLTDPSYAGQILTFTYPLIGNYGVPAADTWESSRMHLRGVVVSELTQDWSHSTGVRSLLEWLRDEKVPVMTGVDTRALTKHLRSRGTIAGLITTNAAPDLTLPPFAKVSVRKPQVYNSRHKKVVIAVDCGMKENIVRSLCKFPIQVIRVPHDYDYTNDEYDAVIMSNGPGDPTDYPEAIAILRQAMKQPKPKPIFGICLGTQLMALAAGAKTYKLLYGHRGHNQPVLMDGTKGYITSQNHGYAVDDKSLPKDWRVTFRNLNDNSVEGIAHKTKPFSSVQFHPEATPGPTDTKWLFEEFAKSIGVGRP